MAELADALDLGSSGCIHASSSLVTRTKKEYAGVVELADTYDSGSYAVTSMQVQVLSPAPKQYNPNQIFPVGDGFGLFVYFEKFEDTHFKNGIIKRPTSKPRGPRKKKQS